MRSLRLLARLAVTLLFAATPSCRVQNEAERCVVNADCNTGMTCVLSSATTSTICCPAIGSETTDECRRRGSTGGDAAPDTPPPTDTGVTTDTGTMADGDASDSAKDTSSQDTAVDSADAAEGG